MSATADCATHPRTSRPFPTGGLRSQPGFGVSREEHVLCFVCENGMEEAKNSTFTRFQFSSGTIVNEMLICPLHDFPITRPETQTQGKQTAEPMAKLSTLIQLVKNHWLRDKLEVNLWDSFLFWIIQ